MDLFKRNKGRKRRYQFTQTRYDAHDSLILHEVGEVEGYTEKQIKISLVKRCGLQAWESWTCLADGTYQRVHIFNEDRPYRGIITVRPIH